MDDRMIMEDNSGRFVVSRIVPLQQLSTERTPGSKEIKASEG